MMTKTSYYFILPMSFWPLIVSLNSFNLMVSLLMFLKYSFLKIFMTNFMNITISSFIWWSTYSKEMNLKGDNSFNLESGVKFSLIMFIMSEVFFFFSLFWSYFHFFLSPMLELGLIWPPVMVESFKFLNVPLVNTLILLTSGITVTISHNYMVMGSLSKVSLNLVLTIILGLIFSFFQYMEYSNSFFSFNDSTFGTSFFFLTGFHGMHVLIGSIYLFYSLMMIFKSGMVKENSTSFEMSSWYWHFVDVVWIFLYFFLYYIND